MQSLSPPRPSRLRSATPLLRSCSRTSGVQPRHPAYKQPARLVRQAQARPSELPLVSTSSVSSTSSLNSSGEETPDWTFRTTGISHASGLHLPRRFTPAPDPSSGVYEPLASKKKAAKIHLGSNEGSGFTFQGPISVDDDSNEEAKGPRVKREKKMYRQFAVDSSLTGDRPPLAEPLYEVYNRGSADNYTPVEKRSFASKQSSFEKSAVSLQSVSHGGVRQSINEGATCGRNHSRQLSLEKMQRLASVKSASSRPKFSRSATLEWTFEGPSSHVPSSDWVDSFTRQHGLAGSSASSHQRRSSFVNNARSSLDNPRTAMKHRVLSKSPSAPAQDLNSRSIKGYGSTNSSFEHHPSDPISPTVETRVLVHNLPSSEGLKKQEKSGSWSRKLGITGSQLLTTSWTSSSKRSPTYPLISPSSRSQPASDLSPQPKPCRNSNAKSIATTSSADLDVPVTDFCGPDYKSQLSRASSSETSWITDNRSFLTTGDSNPVRRRIPMTKLHRSPSRSNRFTPETSKSQLDTVVQVNSTGGTGWLSIARNQRAKIKKCRGLGKLYTTVRVEDDDVSVLVTMD